MTTATATNTAALEAQLGDVVKLLTDGLLSVAYNRLEAIAAEFALTGVTYVAVDITGNAIARIELTEAEAERQVGELAVVGYRSVRTVAADLPAGQLELALEVGQ